MMGSVPARLGGPLAARREVHFFWLLDGSTSMLRGSRIQSLNFAVASAIPEMQRAASQQWKAKVLVRALRFASDVEWVIAQPTPIDKFEWRDIPADGETAMGKALWSVADELDKLDTTRRYFAPVIILVTDGEPTDPDSGFEKGLSRLLNQKLGREATRIAVAIDVGESGMECLRKFTDIILPAENADEIAQNIVIASTSGILMSSGRSTEPMLKTLAAKTESTTS
jgi:uncharacterized protein YegL